MTFVELVRSLRTNIEPITEIGMHDVIFLSREEKSVGIRIDQSKLSRISRMAMLILAEVKDASFLMQAEVLLMSSIFGKGPKIFKPTSTQLTMLERMNLNLEYKDFNTPFPCIVVDLPEEYRQSKRIGDRVPHCAALYNNKILLTSVMYDRDSVKSWWAPSNTDIMESWFEYTEDRYNQDDEGLYTTPEEVTYVEQIKRAVINYCLLLDEVGIRQEGPESPNEYAQLVKWVQKHNEHTPRNRLQLAGQAMRWALKHEDIVLYRVVEKSSDLPTGLPTGRKLSPHSRRGHYKMQPHGPGNSLRKRIRIPMTIVNKHLLTLPLTQVYKT